VKNRERVIAAALVAIGLLGTVLSTSVFGA
jgi:hypothetical protein